VTPPAKATTRAPESAGAPLAREEAEHLLREAIGQSAAGETEALIEARRESLTRFANNEIHQNVTSSNHTLTLRVRDLMHRSLATGERTPRCPDIQSIAGNLQSDPQGTLKLMVTSELGVSGIGRWIDGFTAAVFGCSGDFGV